MRSPKWNFCINTRQAQGMSQKRIEDGRCELLSFSTHRPIPTIGTCTKTYIRSSQIKSTFQQAFGLSGLQKNINKRKGHDGGKGTVGG